LQAAGLSWRQNLQRSRYGTSPINTGTYIRTGTLANKTNFRILTVGREMEFFSTFYLKYLLFGTGIFGRKHQPIRPIRAPMLVWKTHGGQLIFARSVRGTIWPGKKDEVVTKMMDAFKKGVRDYR
jgi:hypothetical protein